MLSTRRIGGPSRLRQTTRRIGGPA